MNEHMIIYMWRVVKLGEPLLVEPLCQVEITNTTTVGTLSKVLEDHILPLGPNACICCTRNDETEYLPLGAFLLSIMEQVGMSFIELVCLSVQCGKMDVWVSELYTDAIFQANRASGNNPTIQIRKGVRARD